MQLKIKISLFLVVFTVQILQVKIVQASEINRKLEASALKNGYAIRLLRPLPRRNSGCETIFRNGKVLDSCEPNYGVDPAIEGVIRNYCEWNLRTHYQKNNSDHWLEPYFNSNPIAITNAKIGFGHQDEYRMLIQKVLKKEDIIYRWIELEFNDQITGSNLGSLKCYPSQIYEYFPHKQKLFGTYFYRYDQTPEENALKIKSGLTIGNVLDQLSGYVELVKLN